MAMTNWAEKARMAKESATVERMSADLSDATTTRVPREPAETTPKTNDRSDQLTENRPGVRPLGTAEVRSLDTVGFYVDSMTGIERLWDIRTEPGRRMFPTRRRRYGL